MLKKIWSLIVLAFLAGLPVCSHQYHKAAPEALDRSLAVVKDREFTVDDTESLRWFEIYIDNACVGHLQGHQNDFVFYHTKAELKNIKSYICDWADQFRFKRKHEDWVVLTLEEATKLWGPPADHETFSTFDVYTSNAQEKNLFHIDLKFKTDKSIGAFRIRGIGISAPIWIAENI